MNTTFPTLAPGLKVLAGLLLAMLSASMEAQEDLLARETLGALGWGWK